MELKLQTYIVDAFVLGSTEKPFSGNPAGVCFLEYDVRD
jgi:predicted PhzF superfamily epimerase YddE/YHI9